MIKAEEARKISKESENSIQKFLNEVVEPKIKESAMKGYARCTVFVDACLAYESLDRIPNYPVYQKVIEFLKNNGYGANLEKYDEPYVPRGLLAADGVSGTMYTNVGIVVTWY
jgi:hypothetical protein